jgi:hypothetical protein
MSTTRALILIGDYSDLQSSGVVYWYDDDYTTPGTLQGLATTFAYLVRPGRRIGNVFFGDNRGRIFEEDTSDSVAFTGESIIASAHLNMGDPGGGDDEGKKLTRCWSFVESELSEWKFRVWNGDERAYPPFQSSAFNFVSIIKPGEELIAASQLLGTYVGLDTRAQPKTVHSHQPESGASGRGFTFEYRFQNPINVRFYGFGGVVEPGRARRPLVEATAP